MTLELVILAPIFVLLFLFIVGLGRYVQGRQLADDAAASAARAASLATSPAQARTAAHRTATDTLAQAGLSCTRVSTDVDVSAFAPGGEVSVTVRCRTDLSSLVMTGLPATVNLTATSVSPLEQHRGFTS